MTEPTELQGIGVPLRKAVFHVHLYTQYKLKHNLNTETPTVSVTVTDRNEVQSFTEGLVFAVEDENTIRIILTPSSRAAFHPSASFVVSILG